MAKRTFSLRIDAEDLAIIEAAAKAVGMTTGAYMVKQALGEPLDLARAYEDRMANAEAQIDALARRLAKLERR